ncbi:hypothetical protein TNCV_3015251 [Trichonephila clavipes]|nr:hypothetical protein TNCV_3015251 [Trichonephila clavipes]
MVRDLVSMVDAPAQQWVCPPSTVLQRAQCTPRRCLGTHPCAVALQISPFLLHSFFKISQDVNVVLFYRLVSR